MGAGVAGDARDAARRHCHSGTPARITSRTRAAGQCAEPHAHRSSSTRCGTNSCAMRSRRTRWPWPARALARRRTRRSSTRTLFQVFELDHVAMMGEKNLVPVLLYLFHRVQRRLARGRPAIVALGEAWLALSHPLFREKIRGVKLRDLTQEQRRGNPRNAVDQRHHRVADSRRHHRVVFDEDLLAKQ